MQKIEVQEHSASAENGQGVLLGKLLYVYPRNHTFSTFHTIPLHEHNFAINITEHFTSSHCPFHTLWTRHPLSPLDSWFHVISK